MKARLIFVSTIMIFTFFGNGCSSSMDGTSEPRFIITPDKTSIPADGKSKMNVTAFVLDSYGTPVKSGVSVIFETTDGTIRPVVVHVVNGLASTTLTADLKPGPVVISARTEPEQLHAEAKIQFTIN